MISFSFSSGCKWYLHSPCATGSNIHLSSLVFFLIVNPLIGQFNLFLAYQNYFQLCPYFIKRHFFFIYELSFPSPLLSEVSELNTPPSGHAAKGCRLYGPVFNRVGKETDASVQVLLAVVPDGTEVVDSHTADFVAMEENYLNRWTRFCVSYSSAFFFLQQTTHD